MRYTFRYRISGWHKPHTAETAAETAAETVAETVALTVKDNLLCAGITCFYRDNCDNGYHYGKMCAGYACSKHTARRS